MSTSSFNILLTVGGAAAAAAAVNTVSTSVQGLLARLGGVVAVAAGVRQAVMGSLNAAGEFTDLSARTGQAVRDLVVLERAYQNAGKTIGDIGPSINLLQRSLSGVSENGEKTDVVFARLGLSIARLRGESFLEQLRLLSVGFAGVEDPADRAALAMKLFGRSGAEMLQVIGDPNAFAQAESEAGRYADRMAANAARMDAVGDKLSLIKTRLAEMALVATEKLLPVLDKMNVILQGMNPSAFGAALPGLLTAGMSLFLTQWATKSDGLVQTLITKLSQGLIGWSGTAGDAIGTNLGTSIASRIPALLSRTFVWVGITIAIIAAIKAGLQGFAQWRQSQVDESAVALKGTEKVSSQAAGVRTQTDVAGAQIAALDALKAAEIGLATAQARTFQNEQEISNYELAIKRLRGQLDLLSSGWAKNQMSINQAADAAMDFARKEDDARKWLAGKEGQDAIEKQMMGNLEGQPAFLRKINAEHMLWNMDRGVNAQAEELRSQGAVEQLSKLLTEHNQRRQKFLDLIDQSTEELKREEEQASANRLSKIQGNLQAITSNPFLTASEKKSSRAALIAEENRELDRQIAALERRAALTADEQGRLDELYQRKQQNQYDPATMSAGTTVFASMMTWASDLGTIVEQIAGTITNVLGAAVSGISDGIYGWLTGTQSFGDAMRNLGSTVLRMMLQTIVQMGVQWVVTHGLAKAGMIAMDALQSVLLAKKTVEVNAAEAATMPAKTAGAAAASVSSFGIAAAIGIAAVIAMLAMFGGFATGGHTGSGANNDVRGLVHANEWVAPAWMVQNPRIAGIIGQLEAIRSTGSVGSGSFSKGYSSGGYAADWVSSAEFRQASVARQMSSLGNTTTESSDQAAQPGSARSQVIYLVDNRREASRLSRGSEADEHILEVVDQHRYRFART